MRHNREHNRFKDWPKLPGTDIAVPAGVPPVRIYRAECSATQSAPGRRRWILEFERNSPPFIEPLMGWTASSDPFAPIRLEFPDCESAVSFAEKNSWDYRVTDPPARKPLIKSYADRFKYELADAIVRPRKIERRSGLTGPAKT
jgi:hypothetical protein